MLPPLTGPAVRRAAALLLTLALLALGLLAPPTAASAVDGATPPPDPDLVGPVARDDPGPDAGRAGVDGDAARATAITFVGRGHGHGRGLSQYGAKGAAEDGKGYRRIVRFYYPGTAWHRAGGSIRVLITGDTTRDLVVTDRTGLRARAVGGSRWHPLHAARPNAVRWRLVEGARNRTLVSYRTRGSAWRLLRRIRGDVEVARPRRKPVALVLPDGSTAAYRGALRSVTPDPGASDGPRDRDTVNVVTLEQYLRGVVPQEVPALWPREAVKAQAVAARSYAAYERAHPPRDHYQVCDTSSCQVYGGVGAEHPASNAAVKATRKQARFYDGRPAFTQFSASNGGWTARGGFPYLPATKDRFEAGSGNPYARWSRSVGRGTIASSYGVGTLQALRLRDRDGNGRWNGRVGRVRVVGSTKTVTVSGEDFRARFGLPSTWFTQG